MEHKTKRETLILEIAIIIGSIGLTCLLYRMQNYKMVILNLFFLPVVLSGFFLGRYRAGITALLCFISASVIVSLNLFTAEVYNTPLVSALAISVWGAVLGMTALLVGTLSDECRSRLEELHEAYVGVVEVLSRYLQSAHPELKDRSTRVAELSHRVAADMKLSPKEIDDIRVAALLYDMGHIEITTRAIRKAVGSLEGDSQTVGQETIQGMDLVLSLGNVLSGAVPLLLNQEGDLDDLSDGEQATAPAHSSLGAKIIHVVRGYDHLTREAGGPTFDPKSAVAHLRRDKEFGPDELVLDVLERVIATGGFSAKTREPQATLST